ncbi:MAG: hypothetical protein PHN88_09145 [Ignavibacteria bacterium]|nr:hypothetical protein [Ignavibacteria bacterium]
MEKQNKEELKKWKEKIEKGFTDAPRFAGIQYSIGEDGEKKLESVSLMSESDWMQVNMPSIISNSGKMQEIKKDKYDGFVRLCQDLLK